MKIERAAESIGQKSFVGVREDGFSVVRLPLEDGLVPLSAFDGALLEGAAGEERLPLRLLRDGTVERPHLLKSRGETLQIGVERSRHLDPIEATHALAAVIAWCQLLEARIAALEAAR